MENKDKVLKSWEKQKKLIPVMIRKYCHGHHHTHGKQMCAECQELNDVALHRLEVCPFKENKSFCSACKIHCYQGKYRDQIKTVMRYSGPRMLWSHPIWSIKHVVVTIAYKKRQKKEAKEKAQIEANQ